MKKSRLALTLTAIGLVSLSHPVLAQIYVRGGGQPTIEVNLDALDEVPQHRATPAHTSRAKVRHVAARQRPIARTTFRDNSGEMVSYSGGDNAPMTYEQAVHMAGGTINNGYPDDEIVSMPLSPSSSRGNTRPVSYTPSTRSAPHGRLPRQPRHSLAEDSAYDSVDNLNRLAVECSAGNMVPLGQKPGVIETSYTVPNSTPYMAPPIDRTMPQPLDLPDTPAIVTRPLPPTATSIETTAVPPMPVSPTMPSNTPVNVQTPGLPIAPLPTYPQPASVVMTAPPTSGRVTPDDLKISFSPNSEKLPADAAMHLSRVAAKLKNNPDLRVELRSVATGNSDMASKTRRLALARALSVRSYLTGQGIDAERIDVRALDNVADAVPGDRVDIFLTR